MATREFGGRRAVELLLNTATALPTVVVGLLTYALLSRRGLLGDLGLLYTRTAMVVGETLLDRAADGRADARRGERRRRTHPTKPH